MKSIKKLSTIFIAALALTACQDETSTVGSSLVSEQTEIIIDSTFTATATTLLDPVVQSRTITQLLGCLDAKEYGAFSSDFVCQFLPSLSLETEGVAIENIDSTKLIMFMVPGDFTGDSLVPMGIDVFPLTKQLPYPIYSDFNPEGYYDKSKKLGSTIYTAHAMYNDSINSLSFRSFNVTLPKELGQNLYNAYLQDSSMFALPDKFTELFPGLYVTTSFGSGRVINISETRINIYYRQHAKVTVNDVEKDTIYNKVRSYFAVTPEVITNNNISLTLSDKLTALANQGEALLVAPAGMESQIIFPTPALIETYKKGVGNLSVLNALSFEIPVTLLTNEYGIEPPADVLLILAKDKEKFFAENKIADNITSFTAAYNSTKQSYSFTAMRDYLVEMLKKDTLTPEDYTFLLVPVGIDTEENTNYGSTVSYITTISPYVQKPAMVQLDMKKAKIKMTYT
ncbi:MAG: DUF4270 domain-containing protein, partial [Paramuribaculum sp.]|nr:DUF4270 domain-containing protein [Paramuribaculum sp.]